MADTTDQLPKESFFQVLEMCKWQGFWYFIDDIAGIKEFRLRFEPRDDDVILASSMKTGTTWLKALCACLIGPKASTYKPQGHKDEDPLTKDIIHVHMPNLENLYRMNLDSYITSMPSPRLFHTHLPYSALPDSIKNSKCKIVYITRNPKDTFVSLWHFINKLTSTNDGFPRGPYPIEDAFESYCHGVLPYGPFFDHVLEYWMERLKMKDRILFLKYEELKRNPKLEVSKLAFFLGRELKEDEVERVLWRSSLDRLKNLDVHKNGKVNWVQDLQLPSGSFFRNGVVGDWKTHLTPEMGQWLDKIAGEALEGSGLDLEL